MKNNLLISGLILGATVLIGAISYANLANAKGNLLKDTDITQELAGKLNVSEDQVSNAFESIREERKVNREQQISENLDKAVLDGAITAEQKQAIIEKQKEFQTQWEQLRQERQDWIDNNGIDESNLQEYDIGFGYHDFGGGHMRMRW